MKPVSTRAIRLATAVSIAGVAALSAGPAFADSNINYFQGTGTGQAVNLQVAPKAVLSGVDLSALAAQLKALPNGVGDTFYNNLGGTLANVGEPVTVVVDSAQVGARANNGSTLTDGLLTGAPGLGAASTPIDIQAKSLQTELASLKQALTNMPVGTDAALKQALQPLINANPSLTDAIKVIDDVLGSQKVADTLGAPTVSLQTASATLNNGQGSEDSRGVLTVNGSGSPTSLLNPGSSYSLDPFVARAQPTDALANNKVTSLSLLGSGVVTLPSAANLQLAIGTLDAALIQAEKDLLTAANKNVPANLGVTVTGLAAPVIDTANNTLGTVVAKGTTVDLSAVDNLINSLNKTLAGLVGINGLQLSDLVSNQGDTARATLQRTAGGVTATGHSAVVEINAVNLHTGPLADLVSKVTSLTGIDAGTSLVSVQGISADASVTLNGSDKANSDANGQIASISVLGKKILGDGGLVNLEKYLPAGSQCVITIPALTLMKCTSGAPPVDVSGALGTVSDSVKSALGNVPALTITLTRGAFNKESTDTVTHGHAAITTLEVTVDLASGSVLKGVVNGLGLPVQLAQAHGAEIAASNGAVAAADSTISAHLVDMQLGVAAAEVSLTKDTLSTSGPTPPKTGSEIVPLAILAMALLAGGIGVGVRQRSIGRR